VVRTRRGAVPRLAAAAIIILLVAGAGFILLANRGGGTGGQEAGEQAPVTVQGELVIGAVGDGFTLDPAVAADYPSWQVLYLTMEGLVRINPKTGGVEPGLAVRWTTPDNGVTWIFILRDDAKFPDGTPVTADVVVHSIQRVYAQKTPYKWLVTAFVAQVQAVNETAVQFTLKQNIMDFPLIASTPPYLIVHPDYPLFQAAPNSTLGGAGPYRIVEAGESEIVLEPNENYYAGAPPVEKIIVRLYRNSESLAAALENGEVDVAWWGLSPLDMGFLAQKGFRTAQSEPFMVKLLSLRTVGDRPTADLRVRQAIALAISQEAIAGRIAGSLHEPLLSVVPNTLLGYTDAFRNYSTQEPEAAKQLLAEVGYNELNKLQLTIIYSSKLYGGIDLELASAVKDQLEETGAIRVKLVDLPPADFYQALRTGDFDIAIITLYPVYVDASYYILSTMYSKANKFTGSGYYNPQVDTMILNALATTDYTVRETAYIFVQETYLVQDLPYIPLIEARQGIAYNADAEGIIILPNMILAIP